jgi:hypothetical protein
MRSRALVNEDGQMQAQPHLGRGRQASVSISSLSKCARLPEGSLQLAHHFLLSHISPQISEKNPVLWVLLVDSERRVPAMAVTTRLVNAYLLCSSLALAKCPDATVYAATVYYTCAD